MIFDNIYDFNPARFLFKFPKLWLGIRIYTSWIKINHLPTQITEV